MVHRKQYDNVSSLCMCFWVNGHDIRTDGHKKEMEKKYIRQLSTCMKKERKKKRNNKL